LLFFVLFLMGVHSALFSPPKYALLPEHLHEDELMEGNAFIEGCTFVATLLGTIAGGPLVLRSHGELLVSAIVLFIAVLGVITSRFIPPSFIYDRNVRISFNPFSQTWNILSYMRRHPELLKISLTNSWFYFVAISFGMLLAPFAQAIGADQDVSTLLLTGFTVGIGAGTVSCGALLKGRITTRIVPWCALGMSLFIFDFWLASPAVSHRETLMTLTAFQATVPGWWRMLLDLFLIAFCGGLFIVPLYAELQWQSPPGNRAQVMACNNVLNAFFMVGSALLALGLSALGFNIGSVFGIIGILNVGVAFWLFTPAGRIDSAQ
jgi:MFS family permease